MAHFDFDLIIDFKDINIQNLFSFTAAAVVSCASRKTLSVHRHSADYIFWSFGTIGQVILKIELCLNHC